MGHSIRSKVKRKFRAIKREKIAAKQAAAKEAKKEEIVRNAMEGVEQSGVATMGQEPPANVLANESTLSKTQLSKQRKRKQDDKLRRKRKFQPLKAKAPKGRVVW